VLPTNVIVVVLDSLRRDHIGCFGNDTVDTSAIDDFEADPNTVRFNAAHPEALPTIPARIGMMTGERTLPFHPWQPLLEEHLTISELLRRNGYVTGLVTDNYHMFKPGMNFHRGFDCVRTVRGQEADPYRSAPPTVDIEPYTNADMSQDSLNIQLLEQYLRNTADRDYSNQEEFFAAKVFSEACEWVERNADHDPFFLWVDSFDPHEPWDPPTSYRDRHTNPDYEGADIIHPQYGPDDWINEEESHHVRGRYKEEIEFVDDRLGEFFTVLKSKGLYNDSLIAVVADHGVELGDHGEFGKPPWHVYGEVIDIPLLIKIPDEYDLQSPETVDELVMTHDLSPSLLDCIGLEREQRAMQGRSFYPTMTGDEYESRDVVVTGFHDSEYRCVRDGEWSFISTAKEESNELYYLPDDPTEEVNVREDYPDQASRLRGEIGENVSSKGVNPMSRDTLPTIQERYTSSKREVVSDDVEDRLHDLGYYE
jgi:arylsulfatase A-like enzyme